MSLKHVFETLLGVKGGMPNVPVGRGGRSDGVGMGVASYVVIDGCELGFLKHINEC